MASVFTHSVFAGTLTYIFQFKGWKTKYYFYVIFLSCIPDLDVVSFKLEILYSDPFGHRGFTHSISFAISIAILFVMLSKETAQIRFQLFLIYLLSIISHGFLDALTTGGLGVAFFWPIDNTRYFLPWRVIKVSPIGVKAFFTNRGLNVMISEFFWVWIPCILIILVVKICRNSYSKPRRD